MANVTHVNFDFNSDSPSETQDTSSPWGGFSVALTRYMPAMALAIVLVLVFTKKRFDV
jgi:hypothetical protein